ncbi:hypothetical protein ABR737_01265 [Streptomyces sp. Edi2]|uniref:hypothetical protein n=1 Tax=Streptomyces sp. Edi2 TaxID=3162528 RepID=UPI0033061B10
MTWMGQTKGGGPKYNTPQQNAAAVARLLIERGYAVSGATDKARRTSPCPGMPLPPDILLNAGKPKADDQHETP